MLAKSEVQAAGGYAMCKVFVVLMLLAESTHLVKQVTANSSPTAFAAISTCQECIRAGYGWSNKRQRCGQFSMRSLEHCSPALPEKSSNLPPELLEFLEQGFTELRVPHNELPSGRRTHHAAFLRTESLWRQAGQTLGAGLGNNILAAVPELHTLLETSTVQRGLSAVLGNNYALHPHRFVHHSTEVDQDWHKDSFWGRRRMRSHLPKWCMLLYYPQRTTLEMGPTAVLPNTSYWTVDHEAILKTLGEPYGEDRLDWPGMLSGVYRSASTEDRDRAIQSAPASALGLTAQESENLPLPRALTGNPARVVLMSYDLFHRATRQGLKIGSRAIPTRFMFKLQFYRTQLPTRSLDVARGYPTAWPPIDAIAADSKLPSTLGPVWRTIYDWLSSSTSLNSRLEQPSDLTLSYCLAVLRIMTTSDQISDQMKADRQSEPRRIGCAYLLGRVARSASGCLSTTYNSKVSDAWADLESVQLTHLNACERGALALQTLEAALVGASKSVHATSMFSQDGLDGRRNTASELDNDGVTFESLRRAGMYGLAAAGEHASPRLLHVLKHVGQSAAASNELEGLSVAAYACHAIGEGVYNDVNVTAVFIGLHQIVQSLEQTMQPGGDWNGHQSQHNIFTAEARRNARETCMTAVGSLAMVAAADQRLHKTTLVAIARQLIVWVDKPEVGGAVSPAGMSGLGREPGREAAAQGIIQLLSSNTSIIDTLQHAQYESNGSKSVLQVLTHVLGRLTKPGYENDRYVLGYALEAQRRLLNLQASQHSVAAPVQTMGQMLMYQRVCPMTSTDSPF